MKEDMNYRTIPGGETAGSTYSITETMKTHGATVKMAVFSDAYGRRSSGASWL